ncbi:unnamed protein product, partial [Staurois parvus]
MSPISASQCHVSVMPVNAHQCNLPVPPLISAHHCRLSVPITAACQCPSQCRPPLPAVPHTSDASQWCPSVLPVSAAPFAPISAASSAHIS